MAKKSTMPNLANATPEFLVDELGRMAEERKAAKKLEDFYKEAFKARAKTLGKDFIVGEKYEGTITVAPRTTLNTAQIKEEMGEDWVFDHSMTSNVTTVRTGKVGTLSIEEQEDIAE